MAPSPLPELLDELLLKFDDGHVVNCIQAQDALRIVGSTHSLLKRFKHDPKATLSFPYLDIINASYNPGDTTIALYFLTRHTSTQLPFIKATVLDRSHSDCAAQWAQTLMAKAYPSGTAHRRYKVLLNPYVMEKKISPVFTAAGAVVDYQETQHAGHAQEIARNLDLHQFDAIVTISGDGLIHEVLNGLAARPDASAALKLPLGVIPAGTSNGLWVSIAGPKASKSLASALLSVLKGKSLSMDLCLVAQANRPILYSFLTQAYGLIADCDLGTEHLRWMGNKRVFIGYAMGALANRSYSCDVYLKDAELKDDKPALAAQVKAGSHRCPPQPSLPLDAMTTPELAESLDGKEGWTKLDQTALAIFYAGKTPWVDPGVFAFPGVANDGLIDVAIIRAGRRKDLLTAMDGADKGHMFDHEAMTYYKCSAYRLVPKKMTYLAVDGEAVPCTPMQVECRQAAGACLSLAPSYFLGDWAHSA